MTKTSQFIAQRVVRLTLINICLVPAMLLMSIAPAALSQALPAAEASPISTGFALPRAAGTLQYAVSASESVSWGYFGAQGAQSGTNLSGDIAYISNSSQHPFSIVLSGGHSWTTSGQPSYSFANLGLSQVVNAGRWNLVLSDGLSYLPGTAATGLSGVPGVGDLGVSPIQVGADTGQGVLTNYSSRIANTASASVQRMLTGKTSLNASGSYGIMRFLKGSTNSSNAGLDSDSKSGGGGISHQLDARNSLGGNYSYSSFSYSGSTFGLAQSSVVSQTASAVVTHQFSRKLGMTAAAGPQWTGKNSAGSGQSLSLFADISAAYSGKLSRVSLAYVRSTNSGFGVVGGAISDGVMFATSRTFDRVWNCALTSSYTQTSNLPSPGITPYSFHTTVVSGQVSRAIARSLSTYASYTVENQSNQGSGPAVDLFSGLSQMAAFGLTYSPSSLHFGRQ